MRRYQLLRLQAELATAGITVSRLGAEGERVFTYDDDGQAVDLPPAAAAIIAAHDPTPDPGPDFGNDATTRGQLVDGVAQLRAYLALPSPTAAQSTAALKLLIRGFLFLLKQGTP